MKPPRARRTVAIALASLLSLAGGVGAAAEARWTIATLIGPGLLPPVEISASVVPKREEQSTQQPKEVTVYVTRTGSKYHRGTCRYLSSSKIPMSLKETTRLGATPR